MLAGEPRVVEPVDRAEVLIWRVPGAWVAGRPLGDRGWCGLAVRDPLASENAAGRSAPRTA